jgi:acetyltransferase-like isoleucine patch superfamily enzyme
VRSDFCGCIFPLQGTFAPLFSLLYLLHVVIRDAFGQCMRFWWYRPLFRSRCVSIGRGFRMEQLPYIEGRGRIVIGDHVTFSGKPTLVSDNRAHDQPELVIGDHTFIGHATSIAVSSSVRIGNHCLIAGGVLISDYDGHPIDAVL